MSILIDKSLILDKIKEYYNFKNDAAFAKYLGVKPQTLHSWRDRNTFDIQLLYAKCEDINANWLLTGKGSITNKAESVGKPADGKEGVPLIPYSAAAGTMGGDIQCLEYECEHYVIPIFKEADFLISVRGNSMYPKYNSGDIVACKTLQNWSFFQFGKVYVIYTEQGVLVKRIYEDENNDLIKIVSENEEKYKPFSIPKSEIKGLSLVLGVIRLE